MEVTSERKKLQAGWVFSLSPSKLSIQFQRNNENLSVRLHTRGTKLWLHIHPGIIICKLGQYPRISNQEPIEH